MFEVPASFVCPLRLVSAVLLLPLVALAALIADGIAHVLLARFGGSLSPLLQPVRDALALAFRRTEDPASGSGLWSRSIPFFPCLLALTSFLLIPPGRFPALFGTEIDLILIPVLLLLSGLLEATGRRMAPSVGWIVPVVAVLGPMSWAAWRAGMPGAPLGLGVFVTKSLWSVTEGMGTLGIAGLSGAWAAALPIVSDVPHSHEGIGGSLRGFAASALFVSLFVPFSASGLWGRGGFFMAALDFPLFWVKVVLVRSAAKTLSGLLALRCGPVRAVRLCWMWALSLALAGGGLVLANGFP